MQTDRSEEVKFRGTAKMKKLVEDIVEAGKSRSKAEFVRQATVNNVDYIHNKLKGQKNIRDFIEYIDEDIEWVDIKIPDSQVQCKIEPNRDLSEYLMTELSKDYIDKLNNCARSSGFSRSSIIRACVIRELYSNKDLLTEGKQLKVEQRWTEIDRKVKSSNLKLVDQLYYCFQEQFIMAKATDELEVKNMFYLEEHYKDFKGTAGYKYMKEKERGKKSINNIESSLQKINNVG
jgi:hypothetical protein